MHTTPLGLGAILVRDQALIDLLFEHTQAMTTLQEVDQWLEDELYRQLSAQSGPGTHWGTPRWEDPDFRDVEAHCQGTQLRSRMMTHPRCPRWLRDQILLALIGSPGDPHRGPWNE